MISFLVVVCAILMIVGSIVDLAIKVKNNDPELDDFFDSP